MWYLGCTNMVAICPQIEDAQYCVNDVYCIFIELSLLMMHRAAMLNCDVGVVEVLSTFRVWNLTSGGVPVEIFDWELFKNLFLPPSGQKTLKALKFSLCFDVAALAYFIHSIHNIQKKGPVLCSVIHITAKHQHIWAEKELQYFLTIANIGWELGIYYLEKKKPSQLMSCWCLIRIVSAPQGIRISEIICKCIFTRSALFDLSVHV